MDKEGNSINQLLAGVLGGVSNTPDASPPVTTSPPATLPVSTTSPLQSRDYSLLSSYISLPLNTEIFATILHVESPTRLFDCPTANWEDLVKFQDYLQSLAVTQT